MSYTPYNRPVSEEQRISPATHKRHVGNEVFDVPAGTYLLNHAVGCLSERARRASHLFIGHWAEGGCNSWPLWLREIEAFHKALSGLLGGNASNYCMQANLSSGLCKLMPALPGNGRSVVLLSEMDFPSMSYAAQQVAHHLGWQPRFLADEHGVTSLERWDAALTGDVKLALIMHSCSNNSYLNPVAEICRICRERGIISVVDIAQSVGVVPIDIPGWGADFVLGCSVKWLCGGQGASFLWASDEMLGQCQPVDVGWWSHENPFEMDIHDFRYNSNAWRFMGGTPVPQPAMIASAAIRCTQAIGMDTIRSHNLALKGMLRSAALANGHVVNTPEGADLEGGTLAIGLRNHEALSAKLQQAGVHHDNRPRFGMRLSPHVYNTEDEIQRVCELLAEG